MKEARESFLFALRVKGAAQDVDCLLDLVLVLVAFSTRRPSLSDSDREL